MKKTLLATVALVGLAAPAMAADLPVKYRPPPPPPVYFSWTGCYIGGDVGGVRVEKEITGPLGGSLTGMPAAGQWVCKRGAIINSPAVG
jgi:outer membrane immunogenic protein